MQHSYETSSLPSIPNARIDILQSKWHREYTDVMIEKCIGILEKTGCAKPVIHLLPGTLELPLAAQTLARSEPRPEAIIAFGIIIKGDTYHFELVLQQCIMGFHRVMLDEDLPIIQEVLPVTSIDQVKARAGNDDKNKGIEAALAAAEIIAWRRAVRRF